MVTPGERARLANGKALIDDAPSPAGRRRLEDDPGSGFMERIEQIGAYKKKDLTIKQIAARINISPATVCKSWARWVAIQWSTGSRQIT